MGESSRAAVVLVGLAVVAGGWLGARDRPAPPPTARMPPPATAPAAPATTIRVHVGGWVASPGVVTVPEGSLVADAIVAAGGMRPGARADAINLAAPVSDGAQVIVPGPGTGADTGASPDGGGGGPISINRATATDLEALPGVGPVLAARIVSFRDQNGPFQTVEDLLQVPGIGEAKLAAIRDLITVP
ncbi:MAG: ComEA family DNA-binding protein [Actinomycetes bacterium]|nr:MAG: DNA-binding protein [Actinomycetota bacterium]